MFLQFLAAFIAFLGLALPRNAAAQDDVVRRIAAASSIALDEYEIGVVAGEIVNEEEFSEAGLFLRQARHAARLIEDDGTRVAAEAFLDSLGSGVRGLATAYELRGILGRFRTRLESLSGVALDQFPERAPSLEEGRALFGSTCSQCHGASGAGDGVLAGGLDPPPADLTDAVALSGAAPINFFRVLSVGIAGTAMPSYADEYDLEQRWALSVYASTLRLPVALEAGRVVLERECPDCRVEFSGLENTAMMSDDSIAGLVAARTGGNIAGSELASAVAYGRVAATAEHLGNDRVVRLRRVIAETKKLVERAAAKGIRGEGEAAVEGIVDAYLVFEGVEPTIKATAASTVGDIETGFADLRAALASGNRSLIERRVNSLRLALDRSVEVGSGSSDAGVLFGKSLLIILREGLEAILLVGALVAFLHKSGSPERKRDIVWGVGAAVFASFATAFLFARVLKGALESQELVEGLTMLVAASVLFWVSYWLVSKIEMRRWQEFVRTWMGSALSSKSRVALAAVAFLAVYREGFETVLFYAALYASADGAAAGIASITSGMATGFVALGAIYVAIQYFGVKIPLKPFFAVTSALLYLMAFSFVGQGIAELQASGSVAVTPLVWVPTVPMLGIFPTMQTVAPQSLMALAVGLALAWVFWLSPRYQRARVRP